MEYLLAGRDRYPWGFSIGLTRGTINRIFNKGQTPSTETLLAISRAENVRLDWLLRGEGQPFVVTRCMTDEECADVLGDLLDENWRLYLVTDNEHYAIVLMQPGQFNINDRWVEYTILEVLAGSISELTLDRIRALSMSEAKTDIYLVETDRKTMNALAAGEMGTWLVTGSDNALIRRSTTLEPESIPCRNMISETKATYMHDEEVRLLDSFRELSCADKEKALQIISVLKHN